MSRYSGKCDWKDTIDIHEYTLDDLQNRVKVYVGDSKKPLYIEKMSDMIVYYPYIVSSACFSKENSTVFLSSESYVDREERDLLKSYMEMIIKIYNRCRRKKTEFIVDDVVNQVCWHDWNTQAITELVKRVKENGKKASIDGVHLVMHEYYRQELVNEMVKNDVNLADVGYERFAQENK